MKTLFGTTAKATQRQGTKPVFTRARDAQQRQQSAARLVLVIGRCLLRLGAPAHRIEGALQLITRRVGITGQFYSTPTAIFASLGDGEAQTTYLIREQPGSFDLGRLAEIHVVLERLGAGVISAEEATRIAERIMRRSALYPGWLSVIAFMASSAAVAALFGGNPWEMAAAGLVGLGVGILAELAGRIETLARLFEPLAAALAAVTATGLTVLAQPQAMSPLLISLAGLIVLLPGLGFTVAMRELATAQLVSGGARLAGALASFLLIGFGMVVGTQATEAVFGTPINTDTAVQPVWYAYAALPFIAFGMTVLFRAHLRDSFFILLTALITVLVTQLGGAEASPAFNAFFGALVVGAAGNAYSRLIKRPASTLHIPGLMLLVPGSVGARGLASLAANDVVSGVQTAYTTVIVAVALAAGLLLANMLIRPRSEL